MMLDWYRPNENGGFCHCGCGALVPLAARTKRCKGWVKGKPRRFLNGHNSLGKKEGLHPSWKGGRKKAGNGYISVHCPDHPAADARGYVREHRIVMERVYGRFLERDEEVHHLNGDRSDNRAGNLEILPKAVHRQITQRQPFVSPEGFQWKVIW